MIRGLALALALVSLPVASAVADERCAVPLADWQPRPALQARLEAQGWTVLRIRADDGCYKVLARDAAGQTIKARFDPATLERVGGRRHDHHDGAHEGEHDGEHD